MKRILYLTFYFEPDLCAGSFRNTPLAKKLSKDTINKNIEIDIITTLPNRYSTYKKNAKSIEKIDNINIYRAKLPKHKNGFFDQIISFIFYYFFVLKITRKYKYDLVFASTSRLFTGYLGYKIASKRRTKLFLDVRDIFYDTMNDVLKRNFLKFILMPILKLIEHKTFGYATHINLISEGFKEYFNNYKQANYSYFTNGIDDQFINDKINDGKLIFDNDNKTIMYAGNLGEGQGLDNIIPQAAKHLQKKYNFLIIGDGGKKNVLQKKISSLKLKNVRILKPVDRSDLIKLYNGSDILFMHLNKYDAFLKVLPSKIFELSTFNKPIFAGVSGYSKLFIEKEVDNSFVFEPCNHIDLIEKLNKLKINNNINRQPFIDKYKRSEINKSIVKSILSYL